MGVKSVFILISVFLSGDLIFSVERIYVVVIYIIVNIIIHAVI